jgi:hypothetical protein
MTNDDGLDVFAMDGIRLEDAFFLKNDKALVENQMALKRMRETKEALARVSDIEDEAVLEKLVALDVKPETLAPFFLIPLIEVAWADGIVSGDEAVAILDSASAGGIKKGSIEYDLLKQWIQRKPSPELMGAWVHYAQDLCSKLAPTERDSLRGTIMSRAMRLAGVSGGVLGIGAVSAQEKAVLGKVEQALK